MINIIYKINILSNYKNAIEFNVRKRIMDNIEYRYNKADL